MNTRFTSAINKNPQSVKDRYAEILMEVVNSHPRSDDLSDIPDVALRYFQKVEERVLRGEAPIKNTTHLKNIFRRIIRCRLNTRYKKKYKQLSREVPFSHFPEPEQLAIDNSQSGSGLEIRETIDWLIAKVQSELNDFDSQVLLHRLDNKTYGDIAIILDTSKSRAWDSMNRILNFAREQLIPDE